MHRIQDEEKEKIWESRRICNEDKRSTWGSESSIKEKLRENEKICQ